MAKKTLKPKEQSHVICWLKRIFSLEFLGVIIGAIGLWLAYTTFLQEKPGKLSLVTRSYKLDRNINTVFYGFSLEGDSVELLNLPNIPFLVNNTSNTITDVTLFSTTPKNYKVVPHNYYTMDPDYIIKKKEFGIGEIGYIFKLEKINPMQPIPWPVQILHFNKNEVLNYPIQLYYSHKSQKMTYIILYLIGIPNTNRLRSTSDIESRFIKQISPYLLTIKNLDETAIIFNEKVVQSPSISSLREGVAVSDIFNLK